MVSNINPNRSAYPEDLADVGGALFFYADDGRHGKELWALTACGDGVLESGEECDDGNRVSGDGCSATCQSEALVPPPHCTAGEECVSGKSLTVSDGKTLGVVLGSADRMLTPPPSGGGNDPTLVGATLTVVNPATNETGTFALPAAGWKVHRAHSGALTYRYGVLRPSCHVVLAAAKLQVRCGAGNGLTLDEPAQSTLAVRLDVGTSRYCLRFGGTVAIDRARTARRAGTFRATNAPAPDACDPA
jgi:cysteine-rich repeat protein